MLPQYRHLMSKDVASITVEQLLTMTSGIGEDDVTTRDWELKARTTSPKFCRHGTDVEPGTEWHYSDRAVRLAAVLIEASTSTDGVPSRAPGRGSRPTAGRSCSIRWAWTSSLATRYERQAPPTNRFEEAGFGWAHRQHVADSWRDRDPLSAPATWPTLDIFLDAGRSNGQQLVPEALSSAEPQPVISLPGTPTLCSVQSVIDLSEWKERPREERR